MKISGIFLTANSVRLAVTCLQQSIPFAQVEMPNKTKRPKNFFSREFREKMRPTIKLIVVPDHDEFLEPERKGNEHFRFNALAGLVHDADLERPDGASRRSVAVLGDEEPLHLLSHRAEKLRKGFRQSTHCIKN